jgi:ABC-2 type transport system ATP-binding protein
MAVLETERLARRFGPLKAVDEMSIAVEAGEIFGLLGPNGAGKTTVIKMLTTLLPPTSGRAMVNGFDISREKAGVRRSIGYVSQLLSSDGALTGYENLLMSAKLYDLPRKQRKAMVNDMLAFMGLTDSAEKLVRSYSGGMIRRLEIGQAILHHPCVLFLDEPTVGLDPVARRAVWELIQRLRSEFGATVFLTTHMMEEADLLCNRVAIMHRGKVVVIDSPAALKASLGDNGHTLDDVFVHYAGDTLGTGGNFRDISQTRRVSQRLG